MIDFKFIDSLDQAGLKDEIKLLRHTKRNTYAEVKELLTTIRESRERLKEARAEVKDYFAAIKYIKGKLNG